MTRPLVVCSLEAWDEVWRRNQFLVAGLLAGDPDLEVLFVEPSRDPLHDAVSRRRAGRGRGLRTVRDVGDGRLRLLELTKWVPRVAGPAADGLLRRDLRRRVAALGWTAPTLWVNDPGWAGLVTETGWPAMYDVTDDWLEAVRSRREHERLVRNEAVLMRHCREVVVCSPALERAKGAVRPVRLVPNAVDVDRFRAPTVRPGDLPEGPTAVYVGTLHEDRLDVDLVARTGAALAAVGAGTLVLVGPDALSASNSARLRAQPGVRVLGPRANAAVPAYLQHADVLVVPHVVDDFTDSLDPIKLYEYRAVGRPVVSTPVAGFRSVGGGGLLLRDGEGFVDAIRTALVGVRVASVVVDVPDWTSRVEALGAVLADVERPAPLPRG